MPYLEHDEAVAFVSPPHYRLVRGILQHPARILALDTCGGGGPVRQTCIACAPLHDISTTGLDSI